VVSILATKLLDDSYDSSQENRASKSKPRRQAIEENRIIDEIEGSDFLFTLS
jgi:hypothetical protein